MIISDLLNSGSKTLKSNKIQTHQLDSELILSNLLKQQREKIIINSDKKVSESIVHHFNKLIIRRSTSEPLAYIFRKKE